MFWTFVSLLAFNCSKEDYSSNKLDYVRTRRVVAPRTPLAACPPPARGRVTPSSLPDAHQVCCDNDVVTVRNLRVVHYKHRYIAILRSLKLLQILTPSRMRECIRPPRFKLARGVMAKNIQSDDPHTLSQFLKSVLIYIFDYIPLTYIHKSIYDAAMHHFMFT